MRRTSGFTLVEMLVSVALVLFIMVILTEAFGKGLDSFRTLKAIGDMESKLRMAASTLRRDLMADHFEGKRRLSDPNTRWVAMGMTPTTGLPREGFFHVSQNFVTGAAGEGSDSDGIGYRHQLDSLYFTVKLRGNNRSEFFNASLVGPTRSPLLEPNVRSTFFDQPADARFQDPGTVYSGQWAEVLYVPVETGMLGNLKLCTLYRGQLVVVADNSLLNWAPFAPRFPLSTNDYLEQHKEMSCYNVNGNLYFNNPTDLALPAGRTFQPTSADATRRLARWPLSPLVTDVISFDVDYLRQGGVEFENGEVDTSNRGNPISAMRISIRVWDQKTKQARQMTILQEL